jgi:hypothetical protein
MSEPSRLHPDRLPPADVAVLEGAASLVALPAWSSRKSRSTSKGEPVSRSGEGLGAGEKPMISAMQLLLPFAMAICLLLYCLNILALPRSRFL